MIATLLLAAPATALPRPVPDAARDSARDAAPTAKVIASLTVAGTQRIEPETVIAYTKLRVGVPYSNETLDQALKDIQASGLFADVTIEGVTSGAITIRVRENPIVNRIVLEGNKRLKDDKITKELKLAPRQVFSRSNVRADVARIVELYRRQGRFAASVDPKMVLLDQNRVDIVFVISEGPKSKVRQINILGAHQFGEDALRAQLATKQARAWRLLSSTTTYDADRLAYDQQKLRQLYLTQGYADFRVTSAVAELTPDKRDFVITYVVEEGPRYRFGDVGVESDIRDFDGTKLAATLPFKQGDWYNAKLVEDTVESLEQTAGLFGYAFADVSPEFQRDGEAHTMSVSFHIAERRRSYVEGIDITGNTRTRDKVIRRELRLAEGDAFNSVQVQRSQDRINSLGYFQDKLEVKQVPGSNPDAVVLQTSVEEKSTGELSLSAGYSSLESFIVQAGTTQRNFRGMGQELRLNGSYSAYSKSVQLGFTEPYLFDRNIALGGDIFRRDYKSYNTTTSNDTTYQQISTGFQVRAGTPINEYWSTAIRYGLSYDQVSLDQDTYYTNGVCDAALAGTYLCEAVGNRWTSQVGYSFIYDTTNSRTRPTRGTTFSFSQDFAGLGGDTRYLRTTAKATKYWDLGKQFVFSAHAEGGYIDGLGQDVRLTDRFFLGQPQLRGFDIRGIGPSVTRTTYDTSTVPATLYTGSDYQTREALGGTAYYMARAELALPLGAGARELGLRPLIYMDVGAVFGGKTPTLIDTSRPPMPRAPRARRRHVNIPTRRGICCTSIRAAPRPPRTPARPTPTRSAPIRSVTMATARARDCRSASASTGTHRSVHCGLTSPRRCSSSRATTPSSSPSTSARRSDAPAKQRLLQTM